MVFSSHQLELVERLCESVVLIDTGRVVAAGPDRGAACERTRGAGPAGRGGGRRPGWIDGIAGVRVLQPLAEGAILELVDRASGSDVLDAARAAGSTSDTSASSSPA